MDSPSPNSNSKRSPEMKPQMSEEETLLHLNFMREALAMGELALSTSETPVGCVLVYNNRIISRGMNATNRTFNGTRHAEFVAISALLSPSPSAATNTCSNGAGEETNEATATTGPNGKGGNYGPHVLRDCDLYVTVEPCIMCASLLRQVGIRRVFFGAVNEKFGGTGGVLFVNLGNGRGVVSGDTLEGKKEEGDYEVSGGWLREEAIVLLRRFYVQENGRAPEPRNKKDRVLKLEVEPIESKNIAGAAG